EQLQLALLVKEFRPGWAGDDGPQLFTRGAPGGRAARHESVERRGREHTGRCGIEQAGLLGAVEIDGVVAEGNDNSRAATGGLADAVRKVGRREVRPFRYRHPGHVSRS